MTKAVAAFSPPTTSVILKYLTDAKAAFLKDAENGDEKKWTVVLGNEAGGAYPSRGACSLAHGSSRSGFTGELDCIRLVSLPG